MGQYWSVEDCAWVEWTPPAPQPGSVAVTVEVPEQGEAPVEAPAPVLT